MTSSLVLLLIGALLLLIIIIALIQQHKVKQDSERRKTLALQRAIIDETQNVLANTSDLPCSSETITVLYRRILDALSVAQPLASQQEQQNFQQRIRDIKEQIAQLIASAASTPAIESFKVPKDDKQTLLLVQTLKKLKAILTNQQSKGKIELVSFNQQVTRIDELQQRINLHSMLKQAKAACNMKQYGSAKQTTTKAIATLHKLQVVAPEDPFIKATLAAANTLLNDIMGIQQQASPQAATPGVQKDIDLLFQPKKKW